MLLFLIEFLRETLHWKVPAAFSYFSTRMLLASITSLLLTIWLGPSFIRKLYALKMGQPIRGEEECPLLAQLHEKKKDTPTMGGILILFSMLFSLFLWMDWRSAFTLLLLLTTLFLGALGAIDDYLKLTYKNSRGLKARVKFLCQILFSACIALYLLCPIVTQAMNGKKWFRPPIAKEQQVGSSTLTTLSTEEYAERFYLPFKKDPLWILDGLLTGCIVMVSLVLALFAFLSNHLGLARYLHILYIEGSGEIAVYLCAMAGASLGFLWYNGYPAQVFMGDTGSLALGGILGVTAVLLRKELILAIAGVIFVAEAGSVILQVLSYRYRHKKRIFLCAPLHHHFEYKGWPETKVVLRFWIVSLLFSIISVASLKFQ